jgi:hypothetical protein
MHVPCNQGRGDNSFFSQHNLNCHWPQHIWQKHSQKKRTRNPWDSQLEDTLRYSSCIHWIHRYLPMKLILMLRIQPSNW